ncbi:MAG TPA: DUF302 domain-containing protein [Bryobacteraceae bacterium]|nr:DUF302 domain-containing protein [Bryobacteraceae bacterium]
MLFEVRSGKSLEEIDRGLRESAARHKFGVLTVHDLKQTMRNKGVEFDGECMIYEVCNPQQAKKALEANPAVSTALPCRISIYQEGGGYRISTMRPTAIMQMFGTPALDPVAREVERDMLAMMTESA